ncbi:class I adenylate-forming enzyme family protein [Bordetella bronchiseptica]|uniref:class I adenylate-forming enzyme family protein n=1 Tax=Bordetella bronchiseptica TaxID=518 RepID=UPI0004617E35|nr:class I adenylate-forming enzyme family protein [Bordetella bronchiseptica]KDD26105.1 AMP-binding enzyme [Bordetella bronchiseptica MBORD782]VTQ91389.1 3-hydroxybenzoate--CoA/4-hydroxybenzoate--CoA ligase [Bordetella bronchiseptica]
MSLNLGQLTDPNKNPAAIALIDCLDHEAPRIYTHGDLDRLANACARGLLRKGLKTGDAVALMSINRAEFLIAYLGIMRAGMVAVPVNYKLAPDTLSFLLQDCQARLAFVDEPRAALAPAGLDTVRLDTAQWDEFLDPGPFETYAPPPRTTAMILYTSGSTGRPKGVQLSHDGQLWTIRSRFLNRKDFDNERFIVAAPMFHMNALANCKFALAAHASIVLLPQFDTHRFIEALGRHEVTWITSVPTMMALVVKEKQALAQIDTARVRYIRMGSAPATDQLYEAVRRAFPNAAIAGGYGTTEAGPIVFGPTQGRALPGGGGLGWVLPDVEVRLVDAQGRDADEGELWMRTPANMLGYLNLPDKTRQVLTEDGWYISGDVFRRDSDGCYYFIGRADDMFNCGGENIYPGEIEQVIERLPAVMQACVVPVADEIKGHKPVAFVVLQRGMSLSEQDVKSYVLANAPAYQHPRRVFFVESLPLAATSKVDRRALALRAQAEA